MVVQKRFSQGFIQSPEFQGINRCLDNVRTFSVFILYGSLTSSLVFWLNPPSRSFDKINSCYSAVSRHRKLRLELQLTHSIRGREGSKSNELSSQELGTEPAGSEGAKFRLWVKSKGLQLAPPEELDVDSKEGDKPDKVDKLGAPEPDDETALYLPTGTDKVGGKSLSSFWSFTDVYPDFIQHCQGPTRRPICNQS